jgi:hypothetical protein
MRAMGVVAGCVGLVLKEVLPSSMSVSWPGGPFGGWGSCQAVHKSAAWTKIESASNPANRLSRREAAARVAARNEKSVRGIMESVYAANTAWFVFSRNYILCAA